MCHLKLRFMWQDRFAGKRGFRLAPPLRGAPDKSGVVRCQIRIFKWYSVIVAKPRFCHYALKKSRTDFFNTLVDDDPYPGRAP
jgi:hypothetical protein